MLEYVTVSPVTTRKLQYTLGWEKTHFMVKTGGPNWKGQREMEVFLLAKLLKLLGKHKIVSGCLGNVKKF